MKMLLLAVLTLAVSAQCLQAAQSPSSPQDKVRIRHAQRYCPFFLSHVTGRDSQNNPVKIVVDKEPKPVTPGVSAGQNTPSPSVGSAQPMEQEAVSPQAEALAQPMNLEKKRSVKGYPLPSGDIFAAAMTLLRMYESNKH